ncbi:MAG: sugar transferase [Sarcina sp.]
MCKGKRFQYFIKRIADIILATGGLIFFSIPMLIVSRRIKRNLGSPVFFTQERIGKDNKKFKMIKFRSMKDSSDKDGNLLPDEERLTDYGKKLRSSSFDEVPELINVLKGEMSIIGPRPLLVEYLPLYSERQKKRHDVLPGLTGWAQVNGRNAISWTKKFELDLYYIENWSLLLDLKIVFLTIYKLVKREGISQEGNATMEKFNGTN